MFIVLGIYNFDHSLHWQAYVLELLRPSSGAKIRPMSKDAPLERQPLFTYVFIENSTVLLNFPAI